MKYSSRFFLYAPITLFLALAAWVMIHWWSVASAVEKQVAALKGHDTIPGVTLDWSKATVSGFPFRIDVVFDGFKVRGTGAHGPFAWDSEHFASHALTYGAAKDVMEAAGQQTLRWTDAAGAPHSISFLPAALRASAIRDAKGLSRFDLDVIGLDNTDLIAGRLQLHLRRDPSADAIDLMISADAVISKTALPGLGKTLRSLRAYETLDHGAAFAPLLAGHASWVDADTAWKSAGGNAKPGKREIALAPKEAPRLPTSREADAIDAIFSVFY